MKPGHGEVLLAEGDPRVRDEEERLIEVRGRQPHQGMVAVVAARDPGSHRRKAELVKDYAGLPPEPERVLCFPRAAVG